MPSKIQGRLCANNAEAIQRLNITLEQLFLQMQELQLKMYQVQAMVMTKAENEIEGRMV